MQVVKRCKMNNLKLILRKIMRVVKLRAKEKVTSVKVLSLNIKRILSI